MTHKVKERKQKLREITKDTLRQRWNNEVHLRCGGKNYTHWFCPKSQPKAAC
jgi:hypothetical protein